MKLCVRNPDGAKDWEFKGCESYEVYLNGDHLSRCVAADDVAGEVWVYDVDEQGRLNSKYASMYEIDIVKLVGKVELRKIES